MRCVSNYQIIDECSRNSCYESIGHILWGTLHCTLNNGTRLTHTITFHFPEWNHLSVLWTLVGDIFISNDLYGGMAAKMWCAIIYINSMKYTLDFPLFCFVLFKSGPLFSGKTSYHKISRCLEPRDSGVNVCNRSAIWHASLTLGSGAAAGKQYLSNFKVIQSL